MNSVGNYIPRSLPALAQTDVILLINSNLYKLWFLHVPTIAHMVVKVIPTLAPQLQQT